MARRTRWTRQPLASLVVAAGLAAPVLAAPTVASAQSRDDIARADALFNAAKALSDSGQYADACAKFAESKRLAPGLGVTMYLADCYEHIGRTASAWTEFLAAEGLAKARNDKRADLAHQHAQALEPKLDRLTIAVAPTVPRAGLTILRDGTPVSSEELGLAVPVDPGDHAVLVSAPGHAQRTLTAHVGPDARTATVRIDSLDDTPAPPPTPPPSPAPTEGSPPPAPPPGEAPSSTDDPGATRRYLGIGAMGLGVVGIGLGSVFGILAKNALAASNDGPCNSSDHCNSTGLSDRKDASNKATVSTVLFIAGGVFAAGGVALYFTAPHAPASTGVVLAPAPMVGGGGAMLSGTF
jgi:hypothetical protein